MAEPLMNSNFSATVLVSTKELQLSLPSPNPISQPTAVVKDETQQAPDQEQPSVPQQLRQQQQQSSPPQEKEQRREEPELLESIHDEASLSSAIHGFGCRLDALNKQFDFINQYIDSKFNGEEQKRREPQVLKFIKDLASLSPAIQAFKCRFDEFTTKHLDIINQPIDEPQEEQRRQQPENETQPSTKTTEDIDNKTEKAGPETASSPKSLASYTEIESLCKTMCSKGLRKYIVTHLSNISKLREEVPVALKLAPKPAKLVLDCIGRFFLQGIKAYEKDSPMIPARQASVLVLEFFLLMTGGLSGEDKVRIPADIKAEAENRALAWRRRLNTEGGLAKASEVDARGLLLFVACFGIPKVFKGEELGNLLRLCNLRAISDALKASPVLLAKIPDVVQAMAKNRMHFEAIDVASIFGLEDKCSPKAILTIFLQESTKAFKKAKQDAQISPMALKRANEKQLDALKSVLQYSEGRSSDVKSLLGSWQIEEKIIRLEQENSELNKKIEERKRKLDEAGTPSRVNNEMMKRMRFATIASPLLNSPHVIGLCEQRTTPTLAEGVRSYDCLMPNPYTSAISGIATNYPAVPAVPHSYGSTISSLPENGNAVPQTIGIGSVGSSNMVPRMNFMSTSSFSGANGEIEVYKARQIISTSGLPYEWRRDPVGQSASTRLGGLLGSSPSVEGFAGLPDTNTDRTAGDLYRFADSVGESEGYSGSSLRTGTLPTVAAIRHPPYMYQ